MLNKILVSIRKRYDSIIYRLILLYSSFRQVIWWIFAEKFARNDTNVTHLEKSENSLSHCPTGSLQAVHRQCTPKVFWLQLQLESPICPCCHFLPPAQGVEQYCSMRSWGWSQGYVGAVYWGSWWREGKEVVGVWCRGGGSHGCTV